MYAAVLFSSLHITKRIIMWCIWYDDELFEHVELFVAVVFDTQTILLPRKQYGVDDNTVKPSR